MSSRAVVTRRRANVLLTAILGPISLAAVIAMVVLWPTGESSMLDVPDPYAAAPGATLESGSVTDLTVEPCIGSADDAALSPPLCVVATTEPDRGGKTITVEIPADVSAETDVSTGDRIRYVNVGDLVDGNAHQYFFIDFIRTVPMGILAALYAVVVIAVARWRGLRALLGLGGAYLVMAYFVLPGLVEGRPPLLLGLVGSTVIMIGVLYFAHGFSARTSTALLGTMFGLAATALLAAWATGGSHLTGLNDDSDYYLSSISENISMSGILLCGLIISGLGVLNDVTVTQSSAVWEMHELAPESSGRRLFASAMRVGRDHIASTVYTIVFAYAGAALPLLLLTSLQGRPFIEAATTGELAEEIVRTLVGSVGLVLAIPVTTLIAVLVVKTAGPRSAGSTDAAKPDDGDASARAAAGRSERERQAQAPAMATGEDTAPAPALPLPQAPPQRARQGLSYGDDW